MHDCPASSPTAAFSPASLARVGRLIRKELTEILRDRRTILTLVLMPLLLYPLLTVAFQQYLLSFQVNNVFVLGFASDKEEDIFRAMVDLEDDGRPRDDKEKAPPVRKRVFKALVKEDVEKMVRDGDVDVGIRLKNLDDLLNRRTIVLDADVLFLPESSTALTLQAMVERALAARNAERLENLLKRGAARGKELRKEMRERNLAASVVGLMALQNGPLLGGARVEAFLSWPPQPPPLFSRVLKIRKVALESPAGKAISLAALIPFILILMTITGAVYPAIDLTAGERERGTLEILVAAPVPRLALLFAKYMAVLTVAVLTALINLGAMFVTLKLSGWGKMLLGENELELEHVLALLGLLVLFAAFFSAVLLILTSFARSFKEAQAYLIPLMLASMGPGLAGMLPKLTLSGALAVTPLINIVLLARDVFEGGATPLSVGLVIGSTLIYAAAAIAVAARIFGAEEVLYSEQSGWNDFLRRPRKPQPAASVSNALVCLALMVPINFVLRGLFLFFHAEQPDPIDTLVFMSLLSVLLFAVLPAVAAYWSRLTWRESFSLKQASWLSVLGSAILGLTLWPIVVQIRCWIPTNLSAEMQEKIAGSLTTAGPMLALPLAVGALLEELFFRGYLFTALLKSARPATVIVVTSGLFGLMHCIIGGNLGQEQVLTATLLGLVLGCIRWRTGSVLPGMALHLLHNLAIFTIVQTLAQGDGNIEAWTDHVPLVWLLTSAAGILAGSSLLYFGGARPSSPTPRSAIIDTRFTVGTSHGGGQ